MKFEDRAIAYLAFGEAYLCMALLSIRTFRAFDNCTASVIVTNVKCDLSKFEFWEDARDRLIFIDSDSADNRQHKIQLRTYVPFKKVACIDCDTYFVSDFSVSWDLLDYCDFAAKLNPTPQTKAGKGDTVILDGRFIISKLPHFNSGVMLFSNTPSVELFLKRWLDSYFRIGSSYDQVSLVEALFKSDIKFIPLTSEWNYFPGFRYFLGLSRLPIIVHYTNRISFSIEAQLMEISRALGLSEELISEFVGMKRIERKRKIGTTKWFLLKIIWFFSSR